MLIGVPKEIKNHEYRVGLVPSSVREIVYYGHKVIIETGAGNGIGCDDKAYEAAGATIMPDAASVFSQADMIVKVKEPQANEAKMLRQGQILFTFLHLAAEPSLTRALVDSGCIAIAYETVTDHNGRLPLLSPSSEVAGRMSIQVGAHALEKESGGRGILLGGAPGVSRGRVVVLGGGVAGMNAAWMAAGLGAEVAIFDKSPQRLREIDLHFGSGVNSLYPTMEAIEEYVCKADLVVGAVLVPGAAAPKLVTRAMVQKMQRGSVFVDISIDQGGCSETSRPTTHDNPLYIEEGVVHYCVTNMPGAVARTSTFALNNATLPFVLALANKGYQAALEDDKHLRNGLNICRGMVTYEAVARDLSYSYIEAEKALLFEDKIEQRKII